MPYKVGHNLVHKLNVCFQLSCAGVHAPAGLIIAALGRITWSTNVGCLLSWCTWKKPKRGALPGGRQGGAQGGCQSKEACKVWACSWWSSKSHFKIPAGVILGKIVGSPASHKCISKSWLRAAQHALLSSIPSPADMQCSSDIWDKPQPRQAPSVGHGHTCQSGLQSRPPAACAEA